MTLIAVAIVTIILLFALIDSGASEDGATLEITVESVHFSSINYVVYVNGWIVESGILQPRESANFNYVYRWSSPEPSNLTIFVEWSFFPLDSALLSFSSEEVLTVMHGEFYTVDMRV